MEIYTSPKKKGKYVYNDDNSLEYLLVLLCSVININGKVEGHNLGKNNKWPSSVIRIYMSMPPSKESALAEVLAEVKW